MRTYRCWECHTDGHKPEELLGHRCKECRVKRFELAAGGGNYSPYTVKGQRVWKPVKKGFQLGYVWGRRKRVLTEEEAQKALSKLSRRKLNREEPIELRWGKVQGSDEGDDE